ncbi:hypothetical protein DXG01_013452 [Tephrocybe rancida]|nr:hypothetical protein DXG01_013452 [Tephrocybe rancida]
MSTGHQNLAAFMERIAQQSDTSVPLILSYDPQLDDLRPWSWPVDCDGIRVTPTTLQGYRAHLFRLPSCLCALPDADGEGADYTDTHIYVSEMWEFLGEYMLGCVNKKCGYDVGLEKPYSTPGIPTWQYELCQGGQEENQCKPHSAPMGVKRKSPFQVEPEDTRRKLNRLDSSVNPGLSPREFHQLFFRCKHCDKFMSKRAFRHHQCSFCVDAGPEEYDAEEE